MTGTKTSIYDVIATLEMVTCNLAVSRNYVPIAFKCCNSVSIRDGLILGNLATYCVPLAHRPIWGVAIDCGAFEGLVRRETGRQ